MSRWAMDRVEVIVDRVNLTTRDQRLIEWLYGWLQSHHVLTGAYLREHMTEVAFIVEGDLFRLFMELYRVVEYMRWKLKFKTPIALCNDNGECIDMTDNDYSTLISNYKIKKLKKARNIVKRMIKDEDIDGVSILPWFDYIILNIGCYGTLLYMDEVVAMAGLLLDELYKATDLKVLKEARDYVYKVFSSIDFNFSVIDLEIEKCCDESISIRLDDCERGFTYDETLRLVYKLLTIAINELTDVKMIMKRDYGIVV
ncbi:MAG: hypothetical protein JHC26_04445 [Thermofilum sp.]|uniref:hypothetical protein n=1 Tax=Thermofilum sp. TaxID=1961369 RepID=UPI0025878844|nr:hypothetical protein [Thermofilum sp.]MCI4408317.1 hypothetical protein [Thermofilum sp.]